MAKRAYAERDKVHRKSINFAVSKEEKDKLTAEAIAMGMTLSCYIRYRLFIKGGKLDVNS